MNETAGFYKRDPDSKELLFAPNGVYGPGFTLLAERREEYSFPVDGWTWLEPKPCPGEGWTLDVATGTWVAAEI